MYVNRKSRYLMLVILLTLTVAGCASRPDAELTAASDALEAARSAEANLYAESEFTASAQAIEAARQEIAAQGESFALTRDYSRALELIAEAETQATTAASAAAINREQTIREVQALIEETATSIETTRLALEDAPSGKDSQADLAALRADMESLSADLDQARELFDSGDYVGARNSLTETRTDVNAIAQQVQLAREKVTGRRSL